MEIAMRLEATGDFVEPYSGLAQVKIQTALSNQQLQEIKKGKSVRESAYGVPSITWRDTKK